MHTSFKLIAFSLLLSATYVVAEEDDSFTSYESIISELKASADDIPQPTPELPVDWDEVALHAGLGVATSYVTLDNDLLSVSGLVKGIEAYVGANLFSRKARAELAFRNFAPEELGQVMVDLRELEASLVFLPILKDRTLLRMGVGLSARYHDVRGRSENGTLEFQNTMPYTSVLLGFEQKVAPAVSVGPNLTYRTALSTGTFDKSSMDASFRLNASF